MIVKPDYIFDDIFAIDFQILKNNGIKALLFDLDSTLMPSKSGVFPPEVLSILNMLKNDFIVAIISNNKNLNYIQKAKSQVDLEVVFNAKKPNPGTILSFLSAHDIEPKCAAMIGDRPLTDILAGQFAKTKTVLVDSITRKTEAPIVRFVRFLERLSLKK